MGVCQPGRPRGADAPARSACPATLQHTYLRLQDEKPQSLCQYAGKVVLVVNTASYCGFTGQYKGLEELYSRYKDKGLVVLGFPSNDFAQEKSSNKEIADFCENTFGVSFPCLPRPPCAGPTRRPCTSSWPSSRARRQVELPQIPAGPRWPAGGQLFQHDRPRQQEPGAGH